VWQFFDEDDSLRGILAFVCEWRSCEVCAFPNPGLGPLRAMDRWACPAGTICADVTISDINMPRVNGLDFVEALGSKQCAMPHLALISGGWSDADRIRAARLRCQLFAKPIAIAEMEVWLDAVEPRVVPTRRLCHWDADRASRDSPPPRSPSVTPPSSAGRPNPDP
jgi:DNA-binding response OmpR family regulator